MVETAPDGPNVYFSIVGLSLEDFGSHSQRRANLGVREFVFQDLGESKVCDFDYAIVIQNVAELDISMKNPVLHESLKTVK